MSNKKVKIRIEYVDDQSLDGLYYYSICSSYTLNYSKDVTTSKNFLHGEDVDVIKLKHASYLSFDHTF